jgi:ABC-type branched-subunit amino acid transport system permease subunit
MGSNIMKFLRDNGLTITLLIVTILCIAGMVASGLRVENDMLAKHGQPPLGVPAYVASGAFLSALFENWESEFLQMSAYVMLTAVLFQRGSAESSDPDDPSRDGDALPRARYETSPIRAWLYAHSLGLALAALFIVSFVLHWLASATASNQEALLHNGETKSALAFLADAQFWFESFQNWQSEFLSTAVLVVLSIVLRFKGSPESKPVSARDSETGA